MSDEPHRRHRAGLTIAPRQRECRWSRPHRRLATVHPVDGPLAPHGRPIRLGYGLDEIAQAFVLADGDGVADIHLAADGDDGVGIEAAVGPHRELTSGAGVAHPSHRLAQEVGGAATPNSVGPALAQPGHQHVVGIEAVPAATASNG